MVFEDYLGLNTSKHVDSRKRCSLLPKKIYRLTDGVTNEINLLQDSYDQIVLSDGIYATLESDANSHAALLLDFGKEFHGSIKLFIKKVESESKTATLLVRFGESITEAITPLGFKGSTNDHANREMFVSVRDLSANETNESGFRYVYIELVSECKVLLKSVKGIAVYTDCDVMGSFESSDEELNKIWLTAAYTTFLNMQNYLWDGIKRDRLVWAGDMYTEVRTIMATIGDHEIIRKTLNIAIDSTPDGHWISGISSYSIWWILIHKEYYEMFRNLEYLESQKEKLFEVLQRLMTTVNDNGNEELTGNRFIDWPTSGNTVAIHAGLQALVKMAFDAGHVIAKALGDEEMSSECLEFAKKVSKVNVDPNGSKQVGSLLALAGLKDASEINTNVLMPGGVRGYSTFMGYQILSAKALAGDVDGAIKDIKSYWGAMLDLGATTFWEDFNIEWVDGSYGVDSFPIQGKKDIHGDFGAYCYVGHRHSLCHGWASGPCPFLSEYVLGIKRVSNNEYVINPQIGDLNWVKGTYPTSKGPISVSVEKGHNSKLKINVKAPIGVKYKIINQ
ncbi:MAG: alpha-L-rhamnosidase [Clostridia bacterium]|nr:alpha-L-rhamnosidase [Clostridia bacterium]